MSMQECNEYRQELQNAAPAEERRQIEARHRETVCARAQSQNADVMPPGRGIDGGAPLFDDLRGTQGQNSDVPEEQDHRDCPGPIACHCRLH